MNKQYGIFTEPGTVQFERLLPGPAERIWDYLTKSELKAKWFCAGDVQPETGGKVEFRFQHKNLSGEDDPIPKKYEDMEDGSSSEGRVTEWNPPKKLSYTWDEDEGEDSEVTFELIPKKDGKVLLRLTHRRLGDDLDTLSGVGAGWHTHLGILVDVLEGRKPKGFWSIHMPLEEEYKRIVSE
ncbi:SRPBCC family protein [Gracilimonas mengyeensis]|uniref:Uncharacterized conserved protein YndB, AHSA1/START domain n=1 Tax=Gracilimonas mengyeensis TaxID=1302730 RepID=A0A521FD53_9BACT|nr:SRPBCC family protein [Gracilimonas mengyeensis]SMO94089.1 Uncharacterized conserved protein YndB, AHSA1/START domain [Gracilimonas mengyeensis]